MAARAGAYIFLGVSFMRKKSTRWLAALCVAAVTVCGTVGAARQVSLAASASVNKVPLILLDAGHGGFDGGAVAADGTAEKDINLAVVLKLNVLLRAMGFDTRLIRSTDTSVDTEGSTIRERKRSDILYRYSLMEQNRDGIYLCVHQNCYGSASSHGAQIFYTAQNADSKALAQAVQSAMIRLVQPDNHRQIKACTKDVYLIYHAPCTAVLIECGFLSNACDLQNLKNGDYQGKVAFAILDGLLESLYGSEEVE